MTKDETNASPSASPSTAESLIRHSTMHAFLAAGVILLGSFILLFCRLGHYSLWDDEAITAMTARAVWQTGDTSAKVDDHNYLVYRNGLLVRGMKDRYTSPLQFYLIAPFIGLLGQSNFICRLPMALCGVVTVLVFIRWLWRWHAPPFIWWAGAVILLSNASFFLFFRQCRYYGLATMLTGLVAYLYCNRGNARKSDDGKSKMEDGESKSPAVLLRNSRSSILYPQSSLANTAGLAIALAALLAAQYLDYAAVVGCLVVDYLLWGRKNPFTVRHWSIILLPQVIVGSVVLAIWNPLAAQSGNHYHSPNWLLDRAYLLWWNWRDMIGCDFVILPLLAACPLLYFFRKSDWLLRSTTALFVFILMIALAVPTSLAQAHNAEVRYLAPALVLCIGVGVSCVWGLLALKPKLRWAMLIIALISMFIQPAPTNNDGKGGLPVINSTALMFYHELAVPQVESYAAVIDWINTNVPAGDSIYIQPAYKCYPLMFRASKALYAWQLDGDSISFTLTNSSPGEMPTLTALDETGHPRVTISTTIVAGATDKSATADLIDQWNRNPIAANIAMATGESTIMLTSEHRHTPLHVTAAVTNPITGKFMQTVPLAERTEFSDLPDIHFKGQTAPDYMIRFGTNGESSDLPRAIDLLAARGIHYELLKVIPLNWKDLYRPERIWRSFVTIKPEKGDEIYVFRRVGW